jgi:hypothetical protein
MVKFLANKKKSLGEFIRKFRKREFFGIKEIITGKTI